MEQNKLHISASQKKNGQCLFMSVQPAILLSQYKKNRFFFSNIFFLPSAGFDPRRKQVHSEASPSESAEWVLLVDQTDRSHQRAVIIKNKHSGIFLAVQNGLLVGVTSYNEDCKWILE